MAIEKYRELYDLSNTLLEEEHKRFSRLEDKASRYLTILTVLIGLVATFSKEFFKTLLPPSNLLSWMILNSTIAAFISLVVAWFLVFWAMKTQTLRTRPLNQDMLKFFDEQKEINIYYGLAKANTKAFEENRRKIDMKSKLLTYGHVMIICVVVFLVLLLALSFVQGWPGISVPKNP
jgi:hypothetical protein